MIQRTPPRPIDFQFPATTPHAGMPLGNGTLGALVWGEDHTLRVTINRQDYWQHQNIVRWKPAATYENVCRKVREDMTEEAPEFMGPDDPHKPMPTRLPMGRFDLALPNAISNAKLEVASGLAVLSEDVRAVLLRDKPVIVFHAPGATVQAVPNNSPEVVAYREKWGMAHPEVFDDGNFNGWVQVIDGLPAMCAASLRRGNEIVLASVYGDTAEEAKANARQLLDEAPGFDEAARLVADFYRDWWNTVAFVSLPDRGAQILYDLGMFKLSGATQPGGPAPTIQGPWVEDDRMPPWGSDYHFNVNIQMCCWPMLAGNKLDWFAPLVTMLHGWFPKMQEYAQIHMGIDDGMLLPHAVDDRCMSADLNWINQFDPASGAWTALLLWDLHRYGGDSNTLRDVTYPMLRGTLRVYEEQLQKRDGAYYLPLAPSPEYNWIRPPWGENPSFQLAVIHALIRAVEEAGALLQVTEPRLDGWRNIAAHLPIAAIASTPMASWFPPRDHIALWNGQDLDETHRHPSHLAGVYPFDVFSPEDNTLLTHSFEYWVKMGTGLWSGWGTVWAVILWARRGEGNTAGWMLDSYRRFFTGPNHASRHDAQIPGFTVLDDMVDVMQLDAALGAPAAILEMLAHERDGKTYLAPAVPDDWRDLVFEGLRLPGGRFASGVRENGLWTTLEVTG